MLNVSRETALDQSVLEVLGIQEEFTLDHLYEEPDSVLLILVREMSHIFYALVFLLFKRDRKSKWFNCRII